MRRLFCAVAGALVLAAGFLAATVAAQVMHTTPRLTGSNDMRPDRFLFETRATVPTCQRGETLFEGTAALRLTIGTFGRPGPETAVKITKDGRTLARGSLREGFREGVVTVPVRPVAQRTVTDVRVCLRPQRRARVAYAGEPADLSVGATVGSAPQGGRLSLVSLAEGERTLLAQAQVIGERYGAGNAGWLGAWTWTVMGLALLGALVAGGMALRAAGRPDARLMPLTARLCALTGLLTAFTWALLTPPFHVPDEIAHVSYTQILAETGRLPIQDYSKPVYSPEENALLERLQFYTVIGNPLEKPPWTPPEEAAIREIERADLPGDGVNAATASNNPPLYYLLATPVYLATQGASLLDQILPMRLLSVLLSALTVLAVFAFLRELLPNSPWTWTGGALVAAMQPVFGFVSAGVNPDALLFLCSALLFLVMARLLRRGLTLRRFVTLGAIVATGTLTKPLFLGLIPSAGVAALIALVRAHRAGRSRGELGLAAGAGLMVAALPVTAYQLVGSALFDHGYFSSGTTPVEVSGGIGGSEGGGLRHQGSYIWQLFLPRLPFMNELFPPPDTLPLRSVWFDGLVGRFGWLDYSFAPWVTGIAVWVALPVLLTAVATVWARRDRMRGRWIELGCYAVAVAGVALAIGTQQWIAFRTGSPQFTQARYLLPLLALYAGVVAVALRLFGRRAGPVLAVALVAIASLHQLSSMLLTVVRYYA